MKTLIFLSAIIIALQVNAQRVTVNHIPDAVAASFKTKFSIAEKTSWAIDDDDYLADFKVGNVDFTASFDKNGTWIKTEKFIKSTELPKNVRNVIIKEFGQFSGFSYEQVEKIETDKDVVYQMDIIKGELTYNMIVSDKGKLLKKEEKGGAKEEKELKKAEKEE